MLGIDVGFGYTKCSPGDIIFPSVYSEVTYDRNLSAVKYEGDIIDNLDIELEGTKYLVGKNAQMENGTGSFYAGDMLRHKICILTAIALAKGDYSGPIVLGLPISDISRKKNLMDLKGIYEFTLCGKKHIIELTAIMVMPQGGAAYFDLVLDEDGKQFSDLASLKVGMIDIGEKTVDFVRMNSSRIVNEMSGSVNLGMITAAKRMSKHIQTELGISPLTSQCHLHYDKLPAQRDIEFNKLAREIIGNISGWWPSIRDFDRIYITGGGSSALGHYLREMIIGEAFCEVVPKGQFSNSRGYLKCGKTRK